MQKGDVGEVAEKKRGAVLERRREPETEAKRRTF